MSPDIVYLIVGFCFGCTFMLSRKSYREEKTLAQIDEEMKKELALNRNLVASLKEDLAYTKKKLGALRDKNE